VSAHVRAVLVLVLVLVQLCVVCARFGAVGVFAVHACVLTCQCLLLLLPSRHATPHHTHEHLDSLFFLEGMYVKSIRMPAAQPLSTNHITLDDVTAGSPQWHQNLLLAAKFQDVINDDTLLLFEVLDQRPSLQTNAAAPALRQAKRVAWAYLQPVSNGRLNVGVCPEWKNAANAPLDSARRTERGGKGAAGAGPSAPAAEDKDSAPEMIMMSGNRNKKVKLQLYFTVEHDGVVGALQRGLMGWPAPGVEQMDRQGKSDSYPDGIPSVYLQWRRHTHEPIPKGQLVVELGPQEAEFSGNGSGVTTAAVTGDGSPLRGEMVPVAAEAELIRSDPKALHNKARSYAIKRLRSPREPCAIPDKMLHRLDVGPEGAMTIKYSTTGHLLAVGSKSPTVPAVFSGNVASAHVLGEAYSLKMYDTDSGELIWSQECAHHGVIYSIAWSLDNAYVLTASGDGTVKVWDMGALLPHSNDANASIDKGVSEPFCLYSHVASPPAYMYSAVFQEFAPNIRGGASNIVNNITIQEEFLAGKQRNELPRVIAGGSDGRIRVWDEAVFKGYISAEDEAELSANDSAPAAHNGCRVQALAIDSRSRYLISGDSVGNLFVWRTDSKGWYQLLRRFKQDEVPTESSQSQQQKQNAMLMQSGGVQNLVMNADKTKSQVLVLNQCPPHLKLYSTSTYKPIAACAGVGSGQVASKSKVTKTSVNTSGAVFGRAELSPDGRFAVAGISSTSVNNGGHYNLKVWEAKQGNVYPAVLSDINLPYPVRSISWHPEQHVMAVAMVGMGAAVVIYCGERESAELAIGRMAGDAMDGHLQTVQETNTALSSKANSPSRMNASSRLNTSLMGASSSSSLLASMSSQKN